ncbi:MAG: hypothetical protein HRT69_17765 [Flavobacteriaceae bacterium]|nr:hypothetical protein [Flavobacteriaceae bacterium]
MKETITIIIVALLIGCKSKNYDKFEKIILSNDFQKDWFMLTERDSGYTIFNPCDAENRRQQIVGDTLIVHGGHEIDKYLITSIERNLKDIYLFSTVNILSNDDQPFYFSYVDYESGIGYWKTIYEPVDFDKDLLFISTKDSSNFKVINQPCVECWGEECDEIEKIVFDSNESFKITKINKDNNYPSSSSNIKICKDWKLSKKDIREIIKSSKSINGPEWHHLFDHLPCNYYAILNQNETDFNLSINGGSWFTISSQDTTVRYGSFNDENNKYFLSPFLSGDGD